MSTQRRPVRRRRVVFIFLLAFFLLTGIFLTTFVSASSAQGNTDSCVPLLGTNTLHGTLNGANYTMAIPAHWNRTLVLISHGYEFVGGTLPNPAPDAPNQHVANELLSEGYALLGSSYSQNGWAVQQALSDQIDLLNHFQARCGQPQRTIAWGISMGGLITSALLQLYPDRFTAGLPMCGVLAGGVGQFNVMLDKMFALNVLLANNTLQIVHISHPNQELKQTQTVLIQAQKTPQGQARLALAAALEDLPYGVFGQSHAPASHDYVSQEHNQFLLIQQFLVYDVVARAEIEQRARGNPSWNTGVNFNAQLQQSIDYQEVVALYRRAGLSLSQDLQTLAQAPRMAADPPAVAYMTRYVVPTGVIDKPVLTLHTVGDPLIPVQEEQDYAASVQANHNSDLLRQVYVNRPGHCTFTDAEELTAFHALMQRVETGSWGTLTTPDTLNSQSRLSGSSFNTVPPTFLNYQPATFLRPAISTVPLHARLPNL